MILKVLRSLYKLISSVGFGVVLLFLIAAVLAVATKFEASRGTEAVQMYVYQTYWFDFLLALFALSLTLATWEIRPFRLRHLGVIVTHLSILVIMIGAFITRHYGYEGSIRLAEGESTTEMTSSELAVQLWQDNGTWTSYVLPVDRKRTYPVLNRTLKEQGTVAPFRLVGYYPDAVKTDTIVAGVVPNPAWLLRLRGEGINIAQWLLPNAPDHSSAGFGRLLQLQMLSIADSDLWEKEQAGLITGFGAKRLRLEFPELGVTAAFAPEEVGSAGVRIPGTDYRLVNIQEFGSFSLDAANKPVDRPGPATNPAIQFEIRKTGEPEKSDRYTWFVNMPEFDPLHGKDASLSKARVSYERSSTQTTRHIIMQGDGNALQVAYADGDRVQIQELRPDQEITLPWMDLKLSWEQYLDQAAVQEAVLPRSQRLSHPMVQLQFTSTGETTWLEYGEEQGMQLDDHVARVRFFQRSWPLGFEITLQDFREEKYPGSNRASSFSSLVTINDPDGPAEWQNRDVLIYMNHPLSYHGFKMFQSSYERNGGRETTVLSVNHDPGVWLVYLGSITLTLGMIIIYYLKRKLIQWEKRAA